MPEFLYTVGIRLYGLLINIAALFSEKAKLFKQGRKGLLDQLALDFSQNQTPVAWFHCASLGEFEQGRTVIEQFKEAFPHYKIVLTFFSPSGYEVRKNYDKADYICYLPLDLPENVNRFVGAVKPQVAFFVKYEFWHHYLKALEQSDTWVFSISSIFRAKQPYFRKTGSFSRKALSYIDHFFVQNETSAYLLKGIGLHNITISGDTRYDRVLEIADNIKNDERLEAFSKGKKVLIGGSTWKEDVPVFAPFLKSNEEWKAIIAPHDISEANLKLHENHFKNKCVIRYSQLADIAPEKVDIIIIDNIGMLSSLYQYGDLAFIGGAYGAGLHNTLEAATFGLPVFFGNKNYKKFQEAVALIQQSGGYAVADAVDFEITVNRLEEGDLLKETGLKARKLVERNIGATQKILKHCEPLLNKLS